MNSVDAYYAKIQITFEAILETERDAIETAATWLSDTLQRDGLLFVTGTGHSHMIAEEVFYRAGGLAAVYPLLEPSLMLHEGAIKSSSVERLHGLATIALEDTGISSSDLLVVASNSGRNAFPIEAAVTAKERGCRTIALTSLAHSRAVTSRHGSGKRLFEITDLTIDNCVPYGDASVDIPGLSNMVGPLSTLASVFIINTIVVRAVELAVLAGITPDLFVSANVENQEDRVDLAHWRERVRSL